MKRKDFIIEENGKEIMLSFKTPEQIDIEESDKIYAAKISSLIREGGKKRLLLQQELDKFLEESGIWTDADRNKLASIQEDITALLKKLQKGGIKLSEGRKVALEISDKRKEVFLTLSKKQILDNNTIESVAQTEKIDYLIYCCVVHADTGEKYWPSFEDMKEDKFNLAYLKASELSFEMFYGINNDFQKNLPENKFLFKHKFVDSDLNYIDRKTGERVDRDGNPFHEAKVVDIIDLDKDPDQPFIDD